MMTDFTNQEDTVKEEGELKKLTLPKTPAQSLNIMEELPVLICLFICCLV